MANNIVTPEAVLAFPTFKAPKPRSEGSKPVYSCTLLFNKEAQASTPYKAMQQACIKAAKDKFGADVKLSTIQFPFKDAGEKTQYKGFKEGDMFIAPWSESKPGMVDTKNQDVFDYDLAYSGCVVRASVAPFAWSNSGKKGVSFGLNHIQIVKDGPRIDGRIEASKAFGAALADAEDSDSPF